MLYVATVSFIRPMSSFSLDPSDLIIIAISLGPTFDGCDSFHQRTQPDLSGARIELFGGRQG